MKVRIRAFATFRAVFCAALRQGERRLLLHVTELCMDIAWKFPVEPFIPHSLPFNFSDPYA